MSTLTPLVRRVGQLEATRPRPAAALPSALGLAEQAGIIPDAWQRRLLTSQAPRVLLNCSRQSGKSTICAVLAIHAALAEPGALVLIVCRAQRQSVELMAKALAVFRAIGRPVRAEGESVLQLRLASGSRIVALPGKEDSIRAYSGVRLLLLDEAARVPDATYYSVRPMLAVSQGRLIVLSTPFGRRGWYWEAWQDGAGWERYEVPATDCPRISADFLAEERAALGEYWWKQEYLCAFNAPMDSAFNLAAVERAFGDAAVLPLFDGVLPNALASSTAGALVPSVAPLFHGGAV